MKIDFVELLIIVVHIAVVWWVLRELRKVRNDGSVGAWIFPGFFLVIFLAGTIVSFCWRGYYLNGQVPPALVTLKERLDR